MKAKQFRFAEIIAYLQKQEHLAALGTLTGLEAELARNEPYKEEEPNAQP